MLRSLRWSLSTLVCLGLLLSSNSSGAAPVYPVRVGPTGRYLVDQNGVPFLIAGESPQALIGNLSDADAEFFFANRQSHGFNTVWISLLCVTYSGCRADGTTFDGIAPFTTPGDLSTPNEAYFLRVDDMLGRAATHGLLVILDPIETGGWLDVLKANGVAKARDYGRFLGMRYRDRNNLLWMHGNDFQSWRTDPDAVEVVQAVALGIQDFDTRHIQTAELDFFSSNSLDDPTWAPIIKLNAAYTYFPTYREVLEAYNVSLPNVPTMPTFMVEAGYEDEANFITITPKILRAQAYWTNLSGATGQLFGNHYTWQFSAGWQDHLDTVGAIQFAYATALFQSRAWYNLVPDQAHTVVTAGLGTFGQQDYVTAARTLDGALAMAYVPSARTVTIAMSAMSNPVLARWYDPANGTFVSVPGPGPGSLFPNTGTQTFATPGNNADGDDDWVLVLEGVPGPSLTSISPTQVTAGGPDFALTAIGTNFDQASSVVRVNGSARPTTFVSTTKLTAAIPASDIVVAGTVSITVLTPDAGLSVSRTLSVRNPAPSLSTIDPAHAVVGGAPFTLTVTGNNFVSGSSVVRWNGASRSTTFVGPTTLTADIPASDIAIGGAAAVTVFTPTPGGGTSTPATFTTASPGRVAFTSATAAVDETAAKVTLTVARTLGVGGPVAVDYATQDGTAQAGADYDATAGTLTFGFGETTKAIAVPVHFSAGATNVTFTVSLSNPQSGLVVGTPSTVTVTIRSVSTILTAFTPVQGPVGTLVTITGANLQLATAVSFNGSTANSFTVLTPSTIRAAVPAGATTGPVGVLSPAGDRVSTAAFKVTPRITGLAPDAGLVGSTVTVNGISLTGATAVRFGSVVATPNILDDNTITVVVPAAAITAPVSVTTAGGTATSPAPFLVVRAPTVTSFAPAIGPEGTPVIVSGANLTSISAVSFNDANASPVTILSPTSVRAMVPVGATTGRLGVANPAGQATSPVDFRVAPRITSVAPGQATPGTAVTLTGTTFTGATAVRFGGVAATTFSVDGPTQITATVPPTAPIGRITVTTPAGSATSPADFTVIRPPTITSFTPLGGPVGTDVTISGANLGTVTTVIFNGTASPATVLSPTSVKATVPASATTGKLGVTNPANSALSVGSFTVTPSVGGFAPARGVPGTSAVITGSTFTGAAAVRFGGVAATFSVDGPTQITAMVPATALTGRVSVSTPAGSGSSSGVFTVVRTPTITSFTPARAPVGAAITLAGSNLGTVTAVDFGGVNASPVTILSPTSLKVSVPEGVTTGRIHATNEADTATSAIDFVPTPLVLTVTPSRGLRGSQVTLAGRNFAGATVARFGAVAATPSGDDTLLTATVPATAVTGRIAVTTPAGTGTSATDFVVILPPVLTSFTPATGPEGTPVTLSGANLGSVSQVAFGGANVTAITVLSPSSIRVAVPSGATTGKIGVSNEAGNALSAVTFTVGPRIVQVAPAAALPGAQVTLTGTSFAGATAVRFGTVTATFTGDDTQITATVPPNAVTGRITVATPAGLATSASDFVVVRAPVVTAFTPTRGEVGTLVDVSGASVGSATDVRFGGVSVTGITVLSPSAVRVAVPPGALTGPLTVTNAAASAPSTGKFVTVPRITGFGAPSGSPDAAVTLTGSSFTGATAVKFGVVRASFTLDSDSQITALVPATAVTGRVSVTTPGGTATSVTQFVVTAPPTVLLGTSP